MVIMATRPTVAEMKLQCRVDYDFGDSLLEMYEKGAFKYIECYINREIVTDESAELTDHKLRLTDELHIAPTMTISRYSSNREALRTTTMNIVPMAAQSLIEMYRFSNV